MRIRQLAHDPDVKYRPHGTSWGGRSGTRALHDGQVFGVWPVDETDHDGISRPSALLGSAVAGRVAGRALRLRDAEFGGCRLP